jgi:hypothetical protein
MCKSLKYVWNLCCLTYWSMKILFRAYIDLKNFQKKVGRTFIFGQDPDPEPYVFESRIRIQIRSKIDSCANIRWSRTSLSPANLHPSRSAGRGQRVHPSVQYSVYTLCTVDYNWFFHTLLLCDSCLIHVFGET